MEGKNEEEGEEEGEPMEMEEVEEREEESSVDAVMTESPQPLCKSFSI